MDWLAEARRDDGQGIGFVLFIAAAALLWWWYRECNNDNDRRPRT